MSAALGKVLMPAVIWAIWKCTASVIKCCSSRDVFADADGEIPRLCAEVSVIAYDIFESWRDSKHDGIAQCLHCVSGLIDDIKRRIPRHASPLVRELVRLTWNLVKSSEAVKRLELQAPGDQTQQLQLRLQTEERKMSCIAEEIQQLLALLPYPDSSAQRLSTCCRTFTETMEGFSREVTQHLKLLHDTYTALNVTRGCQARAALAPEQITKLNSSTQNLQRANAFVHVLQSLRNDGLLKSAPQEQKDTVLVSALKDIRQHLQTCGNVTMACDMTKSLHLWRILQAVHEVRAVDDARPSCSEEWAEIMKECNLSARLPNLACIVSGMPLMANGPLEPVKLPCCGAVVSREGAKMCQRNGACLLLDCCHDIAGDYEFEVDRPVATAVQRDSQGHTPCVLNAKQIKVKKGKSLGQGLQGTVMEGFLRLKDKSVSVAVKLEQFKEPLSLPDLAARKHAIFASYIAGQASRYVCKVHGYLLTTSELRLCMDLCETNLKKLVRLVKHQHKKPGLPELDVVNLGLMLCSALRAVHHDARYLHMDIKPENILISPESTSAEPHGTQLRIAKLCDFGLVVHLASSLTELTMPDQPPPGVNGGTPGYAPLEQMEGNVKHCSDIYSLGAAMCFALSDQDPFPNATWISSWAKLKAGTRIKVPEYVNQDLKQLLTWMTEIEVDDRPSLDAVQEKLQKLQHQLAHEVTPEVQVIAPYNELYA